MTLEVRPGSRRPHLPPALQLVLLAEGLQDAEPAQGPRPGLGEPILRGTPRASLTRPSLPGDAPTPCPPGGGQQPLRVGRRGRASRRPPRREQDRRVSWVIWGIEAQPWSPPLRLSASRTPSHPGRLGHALGLPGPLRPLPPATPPSASGQFSLATSVGFGDGLNTPCPTHVCPGIQGGCSLGHEINEVLERRGAGGAWGLLTRPRRAAPTPSPTWTCPGQSYAPTWGAAPQAHWTGKDTGVPRPTVGTG